jgi:thiol-disulfide isomerase/thioredoxin
VLTSMTVHTDGAGKFAVPGLAAGFYQVMFRRGGPDPDFQFHTQVAVNADQPRVAAEFRPQTVARLKPGDRVPRISGTTPDGHEVQVGGIEGKVLLIEFWASWNKPSLIGLAATKKLREKFTRDDFVVIGINLDRELDDLKQTARELSIDWEQVHVSAERAGWVLDEFGVRALPERFLVGKDGRLVAAGLDDDELIPAIEAALEK